MKFVKEVLFARETIAERIKEIADGLNLSYAGKHPLILCSKATRNSLERTALTGSLLFTADLVRELQIPCQIDSIYVSSYIKDGNKMTSGEIVDMQTL